MVLLNTLYNGIAAVFDWSSVPVPRTWLRVEFMRWVEGKRSELIGFAAVCKRCFRCTPRPVLDAVLRVRPFLFREPLLLSMLGLFCWLLWDWGLRGEALVFGLPSPSSICMYRSPFLSLLFDYFFEESFIVSKSPLFVISGVYRFCLFSKATFVVLSICVIISLKSDFGFFFRLSDVRTFSRDEF